MLLCSLKHILKLAFTLLMAASVYSIRPHLAHIYSNRSLHNNHGLHLHVALVPLWKPHANFFTVLVKADCLSSNLHHSSSHLVRALRASAEPSELSVRYLELPSSEPVTEEYTDITLKT